jgi:hypothetical protein
MVARCHDLIEADVVVPSRSDIGWVLISINASHPVCIAQAYGTAFHSNALHVMIPQSQAGINTSEMSLDCTINYDIVSTITFYCLH